jgi:hypothetical protein
LQAEKAVDEAEGIEADLMRQMRVTSMLPSMKKALRDLLEDTLPRATPIERRHGACKRS